MLLVGLAALALVTGLRIIDPLPVMQLRLAVFDAYQRFAPRPYEEAPVRVIDIDNDSLARLGQWPWPRTQMAGMVERLAGLGAAAIAFSVILSEPDRTSPTRMAKVWPGVAANGALAAQLAALPDHDLVLANTLSSVPAVLGFAPALDGHRTHPPQKFGFAFSGGNPIASLQDHPTVIDNLPLFQEAASGIGVLTMHVDPDGLIRRVALLTRVGDRAYPSLGLEALRVAQGATTIITRTSDADGALAGSTTDLTHLKVGQLVVPTGRKGEMWLHYTEAAPQRIVPAWRLFEDDAHGLSSEIEGRIVLVGTTASGLHSGKATPLNPEEASVVIHAQAVEQMVLGRFIERPDWADGAELVGLVFLGALFALLLAFHPGVLVGSLAGIVSAGAAWGASWLSYDRAGVLFDPLYPTLAALSIYLLSGSLQYLMSERERRRVRFAFGRYLAPALVERLSERPEELQLGGETRELTLMFCDIRNFTSISERMTAVELTQFINRFLTPMTDVILDAGGTVDKFMGDAIMAFWNAPISTPRHHQEGCRAALAMRRRLSELTPRWRAEAEQAGRPFLPVRIGIGVNSGSCCVGNVGSEQRFDYSALGDAVNIASRLEQQCKTYGVDIVVGEETWRHTGDLAYLELGLVRLKGKERALRIFHLVGDERLATEREFAALQARHDAALAAFHGRDWNEARLGFDTCRRMAGGSLDALYEAYAEQIASFHTSRPGQGEDDPICVEPE